MAFDIILPSIGRESLPHAIRSVLRQKHDDWNLFVIIDGMTFEDADNMRVEFEIPEDCRVRYFSVPDRHKDSGAWARNEGIAIGTGDWIAYLDDDDVWMPHHLQTFTEVIHSDPDVSQIHTHGQAMKWRRKSPRSGERKLVPYGGVTIDPTTVSMCHRRDLYNKTDGWQPGDNHDHLLWQNMLEAGGKPAIMGTVTYQFLRGKR